MHVVKFSKYCQIPLLSVQNQFMLLFNKEYEFSLLLILANIWYCQTSNFCQSDGCKMTFHCG